VSEALLKGERQARILELLATAGRVVAADLQDSLGVSAYTVRRDLDELAEAGCLQRVHGGALARSPVAVTYEARRRQSAAGKREVGRAAAGLLRGGEVVILDGGSTALAVAEALPPGLTGTFVTHSPPVADALGRHDGLEVVVVGGTLDRRAMVVTGAQTVEAFARVTADVCFLGVWSVHAEHGLSERYPEEAEVRRVLLGRADRVVGLATADKLGTVAPFAIGPATALTHLVTERAAPDEAVGPLADLGVHVIRSSVA
jgi:DeoR/GlpR family transcriptional regulator of sugar metabolism